MRARLLAGAYGDAVSDWEVRLSEVPPGSPRVACTIPRRCSRAYVRFARTRMSGWLPCNLNSSVAYENWRHRLPAAGGWFVSVEETTLAAARIGRDGWDRVYSVRIGSDWPRELKRLQTFGRLVNTSSDEGQVFVDAPQAWRAVAGAAGQDLQWLEEESGPQTTLQRLARARRLAA